VDNLLAPPPSKEQVDMLDLRQPPSSNSVVHPLVEHSIDRFDAYGKHRGNNVDNPVLGLVAVLVFNLPLIILNMGMEITKMTFSGIKRSFKNILVSVLKLFNSCIA
jgi:hypothetical protein